MTDNLNLPKGGSDPGSESNMENQTNQENSIPSYRPLVHAPRPAAFEIVLGLLTFNVYFCFWAVARARDLKRMRSNNFEPWLWFFAPLLGIVQLFAFARMFTELKAIEGERLHQGWHRFGWLWLLLLFLSGMVGVATGFELLPEWTFHVAIVFDTILLSLVHARFNKLKRHDESLLEFYGRSSWFYWWEWVLVWIALFIWGFLAYYEWDRHQAVIEEVPVGHTYQSEESNFKMSIAGPDWRNMVIGTYSSSDAEVEFGNSADTAYMIVFKHGFDNTLNSVAVYRYNDVQDDFDVSPVCSEKRQLSKDEKSVTSTTTCSRQSAIESSFSISKLIVIDERIYELFGWVNAPNKSFERERKVLIEAAKSFSVIDAKKEAEE